LPVWRRVSFTWVQSAATLSSFWLKLIWSVLSMAITQTRAWAAGASIRPASNMGASSFKAISIGQSPRF